MRLGHFHVVHGVAVVGEAEYDLSHLLSLLSRAFALQVGRLARLFVYGVPSATVLLKAVRRVGFGDFSFWHGRSLSIWSV